MLKNLSLHRWLDIVLLSGVSVTFVKIACQSKWLVDNFNQWAEILTELPSYFQLIIGSFGLYCIYKVLLDFKIIHPNHWKDPALQLSYPPIYFAAILALIELFAIEDNNFTFPLEPKIIILITIWFGVAAVLRQHEKNSKRVASESSDNTETTNVESKNFIAYLNKKDRQDLVKFHTWLHKEEPTSIDESDDFDRYVYVKRISNILLNDRSTPCHIALTGEFGSGKSSITNTIIKKIAEKSNSYIFVKVDGWGRSERSCAAQILEEIVDALSKHIDCSSIKNIPKHYLEALAGSNLNGSESITGWLQKYHSPIELLRKIQNILTAIDKRLLIILEDFDRHPNSDEAISEIAALLDRLKKHNRINFIINIGHQSNSEILSKICSRREDINSVTAEKKITDLFDLMSEYDKYKNPLNIDNDKSLIQQTSKDIYSLIKTPRDLKQIFRRVYTTWETLAGEIDIYDLLMLNIIRYTKPKAFEFICININEFKKSSTDKEHAKSRAGSIQYLEQSNNLENHLIPDSVNILISKIFPNIQDSTGFGRIGLLQNQRIAFLGETNFFKRVLTESVGEDSDVSAIKKFISLSSEDVVEENKIIIEISKSIFLIEKFIQFYGFYNIDTKTPIINHKHVYTLLSLLTNEYSLHRQKNIIEYFEEFYMNELIKLFNKIENPDGAIEILKRVSKCSLEAFLHLTQCMKYGYPEIAYDAVVLETLTTPSEMQISLKNNQHTVLVNLMVHIFWGLEANPLSFAKYMSLIINTFEKFPEIEPFVDVMLETDFSIERNKKLSTYKNQLKRIKILNA